MEITRYKEIQKEEERYLQLNYIDDLYPSLLHKEEIELKRIPYVNRFGTKGSLFLLKIFSIPGPETMKLVKAYDPIISNWDFYEFHDSPCLSGGPLLLCINKVDDTAIESFDDQPWLCLIKSGLNTDAAAINHFFETSK